MKAQWLLVALTVLNLGLLTFLLGHIRPHIGAQGVRVWTNSDGSVLRGRAQAGGPLPRGSSNLASYFCEISTGESAMRTATG